jgi:hypothetical protein
MSASNTSIVASYEKLGLTPEQIAASFGWELEAVKLILAANSSQYRKSTEGDCIIGDISDAEYKDILLAYKQIALYSEVDSVRERALRNLIDEKKGRKKSVLGKGGANFSITQINNYIKAAREEISETILEDVKELEKV